MDKKIPQEDDFRYKVSKFKKKNYIDIKNHFTLKYTKLSSGKDLGSDFSNNMVSKDDYISIKQFAGKMPVNEFSDETNTEEWKILSLEEFARKIRDRYSSKDKNGDEYMIINSLTEEIVGVDTTGKQIENELLASRVNYPNLFEIDDEITDYVENNMFDMWLEAPEFVEKMKKCKMINLAKNELLDNPNIREEVSMRHQELLDAIDSVEDEVIKSHIRMAFSNEFKNLTSFLARESYKIEEKIMLGKLNYPNLYNIPGDLILTDAKCISKLRNCSVKDLSRPECLDDDKLFVCAQNRYQELLEIFYSIEDCYVQNNIKRIFINETNALTKYIFAKNDHDFKKNVLVAPVIAKLQSKGISPSYCDTQNKELTK